VRTMNSHWSTRPAMAMTEMGANGAKDGAGEVDAISGEGFLLHFFHVGTEVGQEQASGD
jgi:hypothetical protein